MGEIKNAFEQSCGPDVAQSNVKEQTSTLVIKGIGFLVMFKKQKLIVFYFV